MEKTKCWKKTEGSRKRGRHFKSDMDRLHKGRHESTGAEDRTGAEEWAPLIHRVAGGQSRLSGVYKNKACRQFLRLSVPEQVQNVIPTLQMRKLRLRDVESLICYLLRS